MRFSDPTGIVVPDRIGVLFLSDRKHAAQLLHRRPHEPSVPLPIMGDSWPGAANSDTVRSETGGPQFGAPALAIYLQGTVCLETIGAENPSLSKRQQAPQAFIDTQTAHSPRRCLPPCDQRKRVSGAGSASTRGQVPHSCVFARCDPMGTGQRCASLALWGMRFITFLLLWIPGVVAAQDVEVDVELFLAVDVSRSMTSDELDIQRLGYAEALTSPDVLRAIQSGLLGRIAVTYVEWAGVSAQRVIIPWQIVETSDQAERIADTIVTTQNGALRYTSISGILDYASWSITNNQFKGLRRIIDVSGDGPNNRGAPVTDARDAAVAQGITINGLPLMTVDMLSEFWGIPDLDVYYEACVIGGPGAFVIPVLDWDEFAPAIKRKLILEISMRRTRVVPVQYTPPQPYNCLIGEQMREQNRTYFSIP